MPVDFGLPSITHAIWLGQPPSTKTLSNLLEVARHTRSAKPGEEPSRHILWTDSLKNVAKACKDTTPTIDMGTELRRHVEIRHIHELTEPPLQGFNERNRVMLSDICRIERQGPFKNYAAASDVLRLLALHRYGGLYHDVDFTPYEGLDRQFQPSPDGRTAARERLQMPAKPFDFALDVQARKGIALASSSETLFNNSIIIAPRGDTKAVNPQIIKSALEYILSAYRSFGLRSGSATERCLAPIGPGTLNKKMKSVLGYVLCPCRSLGLRAGGSTEQRLVQIEPGTMKRITEDVDAHLKSRLTKATLADARRIAPDLKRQEAQAMVEHHNAVRARLLQSPEHIRQTRAALFASYKLARLKESGAITPEEYARKNLDCVAQELHQRVSGIHADAKTNANAFPSEQLIFNGIDRFTAKHKHGVKIKDATLLWDLKRAVPRVRRDMTIMMTGPLAVKNALDVHGISEAGIAAQDFIHRLPDDSGDAWVTAKPTLADRAEC